MSNFQFIYSIIFILTTVMVDLKFFPEIQNIPGWNTSLLQGNHVHTERHIFIPGAIYPPTSMFL